MERKGLRYTQREGGNWRLWPNDVPWPPEWLLYDTPRGLVNMNLLYRTVEFCHVVFHSLQYPDGVEWDTVNHWRN